MTATAAATRGRTAPGRGFTLIELLIAIAILSMAIGGVLAVFAAATRSHMRAVDGTEAAVLATGLVADARARFYEPGDLKDVHGVKVPGKPRYTYDCEYQEIDGAGDEVLMRVRVRWSARGRETHLDFDTILFRKAE